jgi:hypothetical protein
MVDPSLVALRPTAMAVHLSEMMAFGAEEEVEKTELTAQASDKQRKSLDRMTMCIPI